MANLLISSNVRYAHLSGNYVAVAVVFIIVIIDEFRVA